MKFFFISAIKNFNTNIKFKNLSVIFPNCFLKFFHEIASQY